MEGAVVHGRVVHGDGRGRQLGFPTANLQLETTALESLLPGVYAALARWGGNPPCGAVVNAGVRPTFAGRGLQVEVHVLDCADDLYGRELEVRLLRRLRPERRFASVDALVTQIGTDVEQARRCIRDERDDTTTHTHIHGGQPSGNHR